MTLWNDIADSIANVAMDTFDETNVAWLPEGGGEVELRGIFRDAHVNVDPQMQVVVSTDEPRLDFRNLDHTPRQGYLYRVGVRYYRATDVQPDGEAATSVPLRDLGFFGSASLSAAAATLAATLSRGLGLTAQLAASPASLEVAL